MTAGCLLDTNVLLYLVNPAAAEHGAAKAAVADLRDEGKRIHDAHLLATMQANGVTRLLTFDTSDFPAISGITILSPEF
jgi:predicted nucleic acid-binding protein